MLIVFEGLDGSGKTSLIQLVRDRLQLQGVDVQVTSELGRKEPWSVRGRAAVMGGRNKQEQLHHIIDVRLTHYENVLQQLLEDGVVVLMDRFVMSTMAYQSSATISHDWLLSRHKVLGLPIPELTLFIDLPVDTALQRLAHRPDPSRFDSLPRAIFQETQQQFHQALTRCMDSGWNVTVLNGEIPLAELTNQAVDTIIEAMAEAAA